MGTTDFDRLKVPVAEFAFGRLRFIKPPFTILIHAFDCEFAEY
jgi:hypothetical protein